MDQYESLSMRISRLDELVTQRYRNMLGLDEKSKRAMKEAGTKDPISGPTKFPLLRRLMAKDGPEVPEVRECWTPESLGKN